MKRKKARSRADIPYSITIQWSDEDEAYIALVPEFPYLSAFGDTAERAVREMKVAVGMVLDSLVEEGRTPPPPRKLRSFSGELRVRFPRDLHERLALLAEREGMSLNSFIVYLLTLGAGTYQTEPEVRAASKSRRKGSAHTGQRKSA